MLCYLRNLSYRLCAVFGGVYCLKRTISQIRFSEPESDCPSFESIKCGEQEIRSKNIVIGNGSISGLNVSTNGPASNGKILLH